MKIKSSAKNIYQLFCTASKTWAYAKLCQKTGMTIPDLDLFKFVYKSAEKTIENSIVTKLSSLTKVFNKKNKQYAKSIKPQSELNNSVKEKILNPKRVAPHDLEIFAVKPRTNTYNSKI